MQLKCVHWLGDERIVMLIGTRLDECDAGLRLILFEARGEHATSETTSEDKVIGHDVIVYTRKMR